MSESISILTIRPIGRRLRQGLFFTAAALYFALTIPAYGADKKQAQHTLQKQQTLQKTLTIGADIWCPINCDPKSDHPGIAVELAKQVFEPLGYQVNYVIMPWSRALEEVRLGNLDAVIGANKNDDPHLIFPLHAIYENSDDFYARSDSTLAFRDISSLIHSRVGVIADYGYTDTVQKYIREHQRSTGSVQIVGGETALEQNIQKLLANRIDIVIENAPVMDYTLRKMNLKSHVKKIGSLSQGHMYLGFSPASNKSTLFRQQYDEGMIRLDKEQRLKPLYERYGLHP